MSLLQEERIVQGHTTISLHTNLDLTKIEQLVGHLLGTLRGVEDQLKVQESRRSANDDKLSAIATKHDSLVQSLATLQHSVTSVGTIVRDLQEDVRTLRMALDSLNREPQGRAAGGFGSYDAGGASMNSSAARESGADSGFKIATPHARDAVEPGPGGVVRSSGDGALRGAGQGEPGIQAGNGSSPPRWPSLRVAAGLLAVTTLLGASLYLAYGAFANF